MKSETAGYTAFCVKEEDEGRGLGRDRIIGDYCYDPAYQTHQKPSANQKPPEVRAVDV